MCTALSHNQPHDGGPADWTRLAGSVVHAEMILEIAAPVDPIYAGAVAPDAFSQCCTNRIVKAHYLRPGERIGDLQGMQLGEVKRLVGIDVAQSRDEGLVEQQRLELPAAGMDSLIQPVGGEWLNKC